MCRRRPTRWSQISVTDNIGLYLLTVHVHVVLAGSTAQMLTRCEQTFATLAQLPRHRGHFLNWYDTSTLAVLQPAYVSTVDSGNLCAHLVSKSPEPVTN
jgi:cyclic beta-1,2-glucan synthetase